MERPKAKMTKIKAVNRLVFMCERKKALRKAFVCALCRE